MKIFGWKFVKAAYGKRFYWIPRRLTLSSNPAVYRWGYWNFGKENGIDVKSKSEGGEAQT